MIIFLLMGKNIIPKRTQDVKDIYDKMVKDGYNLEFLNIDYNILESERKPQK